ncbi:hypothetical protein [Microbacterium sp.]|uniref:hypothetical protein n=1 Tax=Microbacterium sp. TaxID=51671 RepID=UPI002619EF9F|nr:hypothetical protein [Microbacterium sp.]MCV0334085.1 hypothetical protein [Microbacterium sp.]MCV0374387.1 hypothetical protein [Microbacterium sp.]MCV0389459.1 hypothetical protein [Microbacterium sp.]MCV0418993.1 hypothetical protein [Microbacterium sp.]MCV0421299.1 hypothetical protein [Microbacterium sp.]
MTNELFYRAKKAIAACPDHPDLTRDEFTALAQTVTLEAFRKQAASVPLLPSNIMKGIR